MPEVPGQIPLFEIKEDEKAKHKRGNYEPEVIDEIFEGDECVCVNGTEVCFAEHRKHNEPEDSPARVRNTHTY